MRANGRSGGTEWPIIKRRTKWLVVIFTRWPLCSWEKNLFYKMTRRQAGFQSRSGLLEEHNKHIFLQIWYDFDRASSLIYGNKMPTRCNRGFYCRSYCLLNMIRAPLCPSSGAQEYYTVVAACGISCCGFQVVGLVWSWGLCVRFAGCCFKALSCFGAALILTFFIPVVNVCSTCFEMKFAILSAQ